jgi:hypothetical protein
MAKKVKEVEEKTSAITPLDNQEFKVINDFKEQANKALQLEALSPLLEKAMQLELDKIKLENQSYTITVAFFKYKNISNPKDTVFQAVQEEVKRQLKELK